MENFFLKTIIVSIIFCSCTTGEKEILLEKKKYLESIEIIEGNKLWDAQTNQGLTNDGVHYYVSNTHSYIEKRRISDHKIVLTNFFSDKYGGMFYDVDNNEILTAAGVYKWPYKAYVNRINPIDLSSIEEIDLSEHFKHSINAIFKINNIIYIGETAVGFDSYPKKWVAFDSDFNYIKDVYSSISNNGINDWQDATVYNGRIYTTDHNGFINVFKINDDGLFKLISIYDSNSYNHQGISHINGNFKLHKNNDGIYEVKINFKLK